jgi:5-methyltetrahydrofolate--homocysteine methyltransferase
MLRGPMLLDGAMGTALIARGLAAGAFPEEWVLARPSDVAAVHAAHAAAGARVLLTCTFNAAAPRLEERLEPAQVEVACARAGSLARACASASARGVLVAGDLGPTGLTGASGPPPDPAALAERYGRAARALARSAVDLLWIESQWDLAEARAALAAARATGLPAAVTFTFRERDGRFAALDGTPAEDCLAAIASDGAVAAGVNCVAPGAPLDALAAWARDRLPVPLAAKPSAGLPGAVLAPAAFAEAIRPALRAGLRLVGACCGGTHEHLAAVGAALAAEP